MTAKSNSLTQADIREILSHLECSLNVLEKRAGQLSAAELSLKSMLRTLKRELELQFRAREPDGE
jgi:hypothetical protein